MKPSRNGLVITKEDHPQVVVAALRESIPYYNRNLPDQADAWVKAACDAHEAVEDAFGLRFPDLSSGALPDKESIIYMTPDQLELALVIHGVHHITQAAEVQKVDKLLASIDQIKAAQK